jgi:hypothetical protein
MRHAIPIVILLFTTAAVAARSPGSETERIAECRRIIAAMAGLDAQRRQGGSSRQMDRWKRELHRKQARYSQLDCKALRHRL